MTHRLVMGAGLALAIASTPARAETFDITTYTPPAGWKAETGKGVVTYTTVDARAGTFCRLQLYASTKATGNVKTDFATDWREIVLPSFKKAPAPTMGEPTRSDDGWDVHLGTAQVKFDGKPTTLIQIVSFKGDRRVPMLYVATADCTAQLEAFGNSVHFAAAAAPPTGAAATTTTDAWSAVPKADWVEVTSSAGKVLVHYPNRTADAYDSSLANGLRTAWTTLVAPHYTNITNLVIKPIQSWRSVSFAEADATEIESKRQVHVVLFKLHDDHGLNRYLEFVNDSKAAYERAWGAYRRDEFGWDKLVAMGNYDRFTVTPAALAGTWSSTDFASVSYYYASSGRAAGTSATSSANEYVFDAKSGYTSDHASASGPVGQAKFSRQQYAGKYAIEGGTKLTLTNRFGGKSEVFTVYFRAVKNGSILVLIDSRNSVTYLGKRT